MAHPAAQVDDQSEVKNAATTRALAGHPAGANPAGGQLRINGATSMSIRNGSVAAVSLLLSAMACSAADKAAGSTGTGLGSTWADAAKMPDFFSGMFMTMSSFVEADEKLNVPFTPAAQKLADNFKYKRDIPYAEEGCTTPGLPISMRTGPIKFTYAPGLITIYQQAVGHTRFIRMNQPMGKTSPKYYGNSVGHFEGDTLVVETADFLPEITFQYGVGKGNLPPAGTVGTAGSGGPPAGGPPPGGPPGGGPRGGGPRGGGPGVAPDISGASGVGALGKAIWGPHGEGMRMVERIRLANPQTLEIQNTIYDDTVWTKPYVTATRAFRRIQKGVSEMGPFSGEPEEWVCTVSITSFDPNTNSYNDKDPEEMVKYLDKLGR
jgi:hypothetical protein